MRKNIFYISSLLITYSPIAIVSSCQNDNSQINNNEIYLDQYINNLSQPKFIEKNNTPIDKVLASTINTEELLKENFTNLPESKNGIIVKYINSIPKKGNSTILIITYEFKYENTKKTHIFEIDGFQNQEDIDIVNDYIQKLNPKLKSSKVQDKKDTFAKDIDTEEKVKLWFDNLPETDNSKNIEAKFSSSTQGENDTTLNVKYIISKGKYQEEYSFKETGFKENNDNTNPNPPITNPEQNINYKISLKRPNGNHFNNYKPWLELIDQNGVTVYESNNWNNGAIEKELPKGVYNIKLNIYELNEFYTFDNNLKIDGLSSNMPSLNIILTPKNLQNIDFPSSVEKYKIDEVLYKSVYQDVLNNWVKLSNNMEQNKITIFMFFKTKCQYSRKTLNMLKKVKKNESYKNKFQVWAFSDILEKNDLIYEAKQDFEINFFEDHTKEVRNKFVDEDQHGYPWLFFVDNEGVLCTQAGTLNSEEDLIKILDQYVAKKY